MEDNICMRRIHDCDVAAAPILFFPLWPRAIVYQVDSHLRMNEGTDTNGGLCAIAFFQSIFAPKFTNCTIS